MEGAIADIVALISPACAALVSRAKLFYRGAMNWVETVVIQQLQEVGGRVGECYLQSVVIECLDANLIKVCDCTLVIFLRILYREVHIGVEVTQCWLQRAPPGPDIIMGIVWVAIRPACILAQLKGVNTAVVANCPRLGYARLGGKGFAIFKNQAFHQRGNNMVFGDAGRYMGVKTLGLGAITPVQCAAAIALVDIALATAAGC